MTRQGSRSVAIGAALTIALFAAPAAHAAKLKGDVVGQPYLASVGTVAVPVLFTSTATRSNKLSSPMAILILRARKNVAMPGGAAAITPSQIRPGDKFTVTLKISKAARKAAYGRFVPSKLSVIKRSETLSLAELEGLVKRVQAQVNTLTANMGKLADYVLGRFSSLDSALAGLKVDVAGLTASLNALTARLTALEGALDALKASLQAQIDALKGTVSGLTSQLETLLATVTTLDNTIDSLLTRMTDAEALIDGLADDLTALTTNLNLLDGNLTLLTGRVSTLETTLGTLLGSLTPAQGAAALAAVGGLQTQLNTLTGRVDQLDLDVAGLDGDLGTLTGTVNTLNLTTVPGLQGQITTINNQIPGLATDADVTGLQNQLNTLGGTVTGLSSSLTTTTNGLATLDGQVNDPGGLASQVSSLTTTVGSLNTSVTALCTVTILC